MAIKNIKERIVTMATQEFLANGYGGTRMQLIADKAGINKALLHYHFRSKKQLYELILRSQFEYLINAMLEIFSSDEEFEPWLQRLIGKLLSEIGGKPHFSRFLLWELSSSAKQITGLMREVLEQHPGVDILQMVQMKLKQSGYGDYPPQQFIMNVFSLCIYPILARPLLETILGKAQFSNKDFLADRAQEIFTLVKYGIMERQGAGK